MSISLHCYTHSGFHAHAGYPVNRATREEAEAEAKFQSKANLFNVFLFEPGCWPRVFKLGCEMPMRRVEA